MDHGDDFDYGAVKFPGPRQERIAFASDDFSEEACLYRRIMSDLCVFMEADDTNCPADEAKGADRPLNVDAAAHSDQIFDVNENEKLDIDLSACSISGSTPPGSKMRPITKKSREIDTVNVFDENTNDSWVWQGQDDLSSASLSENANVMGRNDRLPAAFSANSNILRRKGRNHRLPAAFNANANISACQSQNNCLPSAFSESADMQGRNGCSAFTENANDVLVRQGRIDCLPADFSENANAGWAGLELGLGTHSAMALPPISTLGVANPYVQQPSVTERSYPSSLPGPTHNDFFNNLLTKSVPIDVEYLNMFQIFLDRSPTVSSNTPPAATTTSDYCAFCKKNGESSVVYTSHSLKALSGGRQIVTCPILREIVCRTCGATGDHAHTQSYCPLVKALNNGNKPESTAVLIRNSKIKSNGKPRY